MGNDIHFEVDRFKQALQDSADMTRKFPLDNAGLYAFAALQKHHLFIVESYLRMLDRYEELEKIVERYEALVHGS